MSGIYVHIPFCLHKCAYCDFCSFQASESEMERYVEALTTEMALLSEQHHGAAFTTVFVGGGTPTALPVRLLRRVLEALGERFDLSGVREYTVEANPATVTEAHAALFREVGVTRVSLGLQSSHDRLLKLLGRAHDWEGFLQTYALLRQSGPWDINVDLIYHLPGQTRKAWQETLEAVAALKPEHISCYSLQLEEGTPLERRVAAGTLRLTSDRNDRWMHHYAMDFLERSGYRHYEISNFARPGHESLHNLGYWSRSPYLGIGLGAHGFDGRHRTANPETLAAYTEPLEQRRLPGAVVETLTEKEALFEALMLGLRLMSGVRIDALEEAFGKDRLEAYAEVLKTLRGQGLLDKDPAVLRLTRRGMDLSNRVFSALMDP